jgi:hypothetical protein
MLSPRHVHLHHMLDTVSGKRQLSHIRISTNTNRCRTPRASVLRPRASLCQCLRHRDRGFDSITKSPIPPIERKTFGARYGPGRKQSWGPRIPGRITAKVCFVDVIILAGSWLHKRNRYSNKKGAHHIEKNIQLNIWRYFNANRGIYNRVSS